LERTGGTTTVEHPVGDRVRRRLERLSHDVEEDEVAPTEPAQRACQEYLTAAALGMPPGQDFPFPHISTAGEGDLSCEWRLADKVVLAMISPDGVLALHVLGLSEGLVAAQQTVPNPTPKDLHSALRRFPASRPAVP
jgi:hypothetical protein